MDGEVEQTTGTPPPDTPLENGERNSSPNLPELSSRLQEVIDKCSESECFQTLVEEIKTMGDADKAKHFLNYFINSEESVKQQVLEVICNLGMSETMDYLKSKTETSEVVDNHTVPENGHEDVSLPDNNNNNLIEDTNETTLKSYKEVLKETCGTFVDCLSPSPQLLLHLNKSSVLSESMVSKISCRPNRADKVRVLLSFLINLGPESLNAFVKALQATEQHFLAGVVSAFEYT